MQSQDVSPAIPGHPRPSGHPSVVLPNGFRARGGTPTSITFSGHLFGESELLAVADAYQQATDFHRRRPLLPTAPNSTG